MIKKKLIIWWVDDEPDRLGGTARGRIEEPTISALRGRKAKIEPQLLKNEEQRIQLEKSLVQAKSTKSLPDLIVVDQILNRNDGVVRRGSSVAVAFRAQAPSVPIVGVTAAAFNDVAELQKDQFIEFFCLDEIQSGSHIPNLYAIADGFSRLVAVKSASKEPGKHLNTLLKLVDCPREDIDFLSSCLPGEFLSPWDDETPHSIARWIWHTFIGRAGFLNNDLEIATMLGLNELGLSKIIKHIADCTYNGVFASPARRRWWVSQVRYKIRAITNASVTDPLWQIGRNLTKRQPSGFSRCHGELNDDCIPDVVAYEDDTRRQMIQARSEDTKPIPTDTPPIGFEQRRVFSKK